MALQIMSRPLWSTTKNIEVSSDFTHNMYIVNYWVPFPASEYGGIVTVIAKTEEEASKLLNSDTCDYKYYNEKYDYLIENAVAKSQRFPLCGEYTSKVVDIFIT